MKVFCFDNDKNTEKLFSNIISSNKFGVESFRFSENPLEIDIYEEVSSDSVFFIDTRLQLKKQNSFSLAARIRERFPLCHIIFMSQYPEDMAFWFKNLVRPSGFLLKPMAPNEIMSLLSAIDSLSKKSARAKSILISTRELKRNVELSRIVYFSTSAKKLYCRQTDGEQVEFYGTISKLEEDLESEYVRSHSGFLVNKSFIKGLVKGELELFGCKETLPVSKKYKTRVVV